MCKECTGVRKESVVGKAIEESQFFWNGIWEGKSRGGEG